MGTVYKATQVSLGRTVALKVLAPELAQDERFCNMFIKEARAAGSLNHPNIIQVYDVGEEDVYYFFSMEFAAKGSVLDELQTGGPIALPRALRILRDACNALDYAERKGLVHRDIKPDNLMVTEDDSVKLGDLGLAMSTVELQGEQDGVFGTPHYIAPEQALGRPIDHRADIYGLGATFYRILTGKTVFSGSSVKEILKRQVREPHKPVTQLIPDCPPAVSRIIDRMLAKAPAERYQHASDILSDLTDYEYQASRHSMQDSAAFASRPRGLTPEQNQQVAKRRKFKLIVGVTVPVVVVALMLGALLAFGGGEPPPGPTEPDNGRPDPRPRVNTIPPDVAQANQSLRIELGVANRMVDRENPTVDQITDAVSVLDRALRQNTRADSETREVVRARREEIKAKLQAIQQTVADVEEEWNGVFRQTGIMIEGFRFIAAKELVEEFVARHEESPYDEVLEQVEGAREYVRTTWPVRVSGQMSRFESSISDARENISALPLSERVPKAEEQAARIEAAIEASDEPQSRARLEELQRDFARFVNVLRENVERESRQQVLEALGPSLRNLREVLDQVAADVAAGAFARAEQRLRDWESEDEGFLAYGERDLYEPARAELEYRRARTALIRQGITQLADNGGRALPSLIQQTNILVQNPWPAPVAAMLGDNQTAVRIQVVPGEADDIWLLYVSRDKSIRASELDPGAFAALLLHVLEHSPDLRENLNTRLASGVALGVAVSAWLVDMGESDTAERFMRHAENLEPEDNPARDLHRETMAHNLHAMAATALAAGNRTKAGEYISRIRNNYPDSIAAHRE
jgi:serine/threonine protein kinase